MNRYWPFINPFDEPTAEIPLLREAFADWKIGGGIFTAIEDLDVDLPWQDSVDSTTLDIEYFGNRSGAKFSAPVVMNLLGETQELLDSDREILAKIIVTKFGEPWKHLWDTNVIAYNPIHNYNMIDRREMAKGESEAKVATDSSVDTTTHGRGSEVQENVAGLNNTNNKGKLADVSISQESGTTEVAGDRNSKDDTVRASNEVETTTRSGNIGVTTTQAMLVAEREVWMWNFFDQVYKDIDSVLSLPFYDPCRI